MEPITTENVAEIKELGTLYSFKDQQVQSHRNKIRISNGLAFDYKLQKMYHIDSLKGTVDQYELDLQNGKISKFQRE